MLSCKRVLQFYAFERYFVSIDDVGYSKFIKYTCLPARVSAVYSQR